METKKDYRYESTEDIIKAANESDNELMKELAKRLEERTMPRTDRNHARGKFAADVMSEFVNSYDFDKKGFAEAILSEHRTVQQSFISLMLFTLREFAVMNPACVDGRNRRGVDVCRKITDFMEENELPFTLPLI